MYRDLGNCSSSEFMKSIVVDGRGQLKNNRLDGGGTKLLPRFLLKMKHQEVQCVCESQEVP